MTIFEAYMRMTGNPVKATAYLDNLTSKITHPGFLSDLSPLLAEGVEDYDPDKAFAIVRDRLVSNLGAAGY